MSVDQLDTAGGWTVTVNVGGGPGGSAVRTSGMCAWARTASAERRPLLVFAQEVTDAFVEVWREAGYSVHIGVNRGWLIRSALLAAPGEVLTELTPSIDNLQYHGDYVAARRWDSSTGPVVVASVHASPQLAEPVRYGWVGACPPPREGGSHSRYPPRRLWDADLLLETLRGLAGGGLPLLAAGDFNEARGFDADDGGTWGAEYFERLEQHGLVDWTYDVWGGERPTRGKLQLDHVVVNKAGRSLPSAQGVEIDAAWKDWPSHLSDHAPVWFRLT